MTRQEALEIARGDIRLGYCSACGFISNVAFNASLQSYSTDRYEATQAFSGTFNAFHRNLAQYLIDKYDLHGKQIIEIGCGQGEFLGLLCSLGENSGIGFDPAYVEGRWGNVANDRMRVIKDYYQEDNAREYPADFVCCKMTLEHIQETYTFVDLVYRSVQHRPDTIVVFQVPDTKHVLQSVAFWDIYYEHCSYFSQYSLEHLFQLCGFEILSSSAEYDGQYLLIEARPSESRTDRAGHDVALRAEIETAVTHFSLHASSAIQQWKAKLRDLFTAGQKTAIWGGSSKTVAFLTTLGIGEEVRFIIDINPNKHGTFLAGTGHEIVSPAVLTSHQPDTIIVMNPIYMKEIKDMLGGLGVACDLMAVNESGPHASTQAQSKPRSERDTG